MGDMIENDKDLDIEIKEEQIKNDKKSNHRRKQTIKNVAVNSPKTKIKKKEENKSKDKKVSVLMSTPRKRSNSVVLPVKEKEIKQKENKKKQRQSPSNVIKKKRSQSTEFSDCHYCKNKKNKECKY